ncbi:MAG TPA: protein ndvB, partial [Polyangiaceae bacterium]
SSRAPETDRTSEGDQARAAESEIRRAHVQQALDQVTIGNAITSMRTIAAFDWTRFFERTSLVESILRADPQDLYLNTDEASRDRYRHAVEELAERSRLTELEVATRALTMAQAAATERSAEPFAAHVGFYLVDNGRPELESAIGFRPTAKMRRVRGLLAHPGRSYFGSIALLLVVLLGAFGVHVSSSGERALVLAGMLLFAILPASEFVIAVVNALTVAVLEPRVLSKLSLEDGIPEPLRTLVVVPTFIGSEATIDDLLDGLEIRALGNLESNLHFALLSDFPDGDQEETDADLALLEYARRGVEALNRRHPGSGSDRFLLFHRRRVWNPAEGVFMGWERKRGKLEELNRLILGTGETTYSVVTAKAEWLRGVKYVITLDSDTELPRDAARKLVSAIAHPLNQARSDAFGRRIRGYGIVQPRIGTQPGSSRRSRFARIMAGPPGIDPYTSAVSDVYQDLFGSGSYVGKAIYDVAAFAHALEQRVPENALLSHDLFEGLFAHTALATDIELLDEQPSSYASVAAREHRWIRGDFQVLPWLFGTVPGALGRRPSDLSSLGAWKLFDNLRRALVAPSLVALALFGSFRGARTGRSALAVVLIALTAPLYARLAAVLYRPRGGALPSLAPVVSELWAQLGQISISAVFLLDRACLALDAALRACYRMAVSRKHLLEWQTASDATVSYAGTLSIRTWGTAVAAAAILATGILLTPGTMLFAAPLLTLWIAAPVFALALSKPLPPRVIPELSDADRGYLRGIAFKTWRFFEVFVTEEDHFLPPDNYQEDPLGVVAHRTSPTNIGA